MAGEQRNAGVGWWELLGRMLGEDVAEEVGRALFASRTQILAVDCERCRLNQGDERMAAVHPQADPLLFGEVANYLEAHGAHGAIDVALKGSRGKLSATSAEVIMRALHAMRMSLAKRMRAIADEPTPRGKALRGRLS